VNTPLELVVVLLAIPVAVLVAVTDAPTMTAPEGSVTVPVIVPRSLCASNEPALKNKASADRHTLAHLPIDTVLRMSLLHPNILNFDPYSTLNEFD
jgi:hypothetical protein